MARHRSVGDLEIVAGGAADRQLRSVRHLPLAGGRPAEDAASKPLEHVLALLHAPHHRSRFVERLLDGARKLSRVEIHQATPPRHSGPVQDAFHAARLAANLVTPATWTDDDASM